MYSPYSHYLTKTEYVFFVFTKFFPAGNNTKRQTMFFSKHVPNGTSRQKEKPFYVHKAQSWHGTATTKHCACDQCCFSMCERETQRDQELTQNRIACLRYGRPPRPTEANWRPRSESVACLSDSVMLSGTVGKHEITDGVSSLPFLDRIANFTGESSRFKFGC